MDDDILRYFANGDAIKTDPELMKAVQELGISTLIPDSPLIKVTATYSAYNEFIRCIEAILNTQEKLNKIRHDLESCKLSNPFMASNPALIEKKVKHLVDELHRVRAIIEFQTQIQTKLQYYNFQSLHPVRLNHHKAFLELVTVMPKLTRELKENVHNLEWFMKFQPGKDIEKISTALTQTFSLLEYTTKRLREFYNVLKKLHGRTGETAAGVSDEEVLSNFDKNSTCEWKEQKELNVKLLEPLYFVQYNKHKFVTNQRY